MNKKQPNIKQYKQLIRRVYWFINIRWFVSIGLLGLLFLFQVIVRLDLEYIPLYGITFFLIGYNGIFHASTVHSKFKLFRNYLMINRIANMQIFLDITTGSFLIHFSGGVENPFIFYYIFHVIFAGILLSRRAAFLQATYASAVFLIIVYCEYAQVWQHYGLPFLSSHLLHTNGYYVAAVSVAFVSSICFSVYLASSISYRLKKGRQRLSSANKDLKENDKIKNRYILRLTHDIKEDLAAVHSCIEPVFVEIVGPLNAKQKKFLKRARERSKELIEYVNDLLEVTKMKLAHRLQLEPFSFHEIIGEIREHIEPLALAKGIKLNIKVASDVTVMNGVRLSIKKALLNVLENAIKYTPPDGAINFKMNKIENRLCVKIKDTGIGVPPDALPHIFDEFYRTPSAVDCEAQGTGLGLSIVKQIVNLHNGKVWAESEEGKGTTFYFEFPI